MLQCIKQPLDPVTDPISCTAACCASTNVEPDLDAGQDLGPSQSLGLLKGSCMDADTKGTVTLRASRLPVLDTGLRIPVPVDCFPVSEGQTVRLYFRASVPWTS